MVLNQIPAFSHWMSAAVVLQSSLSLCDPAWLASGWGEGEAQNGPVLAPSHQGDWESSHGPFLPVVSLVG